MYLWLMKDSIFGIKNTAQGFSTGVHRSKGKQYEANDFLFYLILSFHGKEKKEKWEITLTDIVNSVRKFYGHRKKFLDL